MNDNDLYNFSIIILNNMLNEKILTEEEYYNCKNDFKRTYKITEDIAFG